MTSHPAPLERERERETETETDRERQRETETGTEVCVCVCGRGGGGGLSVYAEGREEAIKDRDHPCLRTVNIRKMNQASFQDFFFLTSSLFSADVSAKSLTEERYLKMRFGQRAERRAAKTRN